jgi:DNA modification methylase
MCGSGTTAAVAARLGRAFVAGDQSELAISITEKRLASYGVPFTRL